MNRKKSKAGFSLIEMLMALMILVFIVIGMGVGMNAGTRIYQEAIFESDSASLAGILNTNLGDILRYSRNITPNPGTLEDSSGSFISAEDVEFVFTNYEYGIQNAYFYTPLYADGTSKGVLQMKNLQNDQIVELVNSGAYPDLLISDFEISYVAPGSAAADGSTLRGGYFNISYRIYSENNGDLSRNVECVVRMMNA